MQSNKARWLTLLAVAVIFFGVTVAIGLALVPEPRTPTDHLVIGTIATLVALAAVFVMIITTIYRGKENFVRQRPKPNELSPTDSDESPNT